MSEATWVVVSRIADVLGITAVIVTPLYFVFRGVGVVDVDDQAWLSATIGTGVAGLLLIVSGILHNLNPYAVANPERRDYGRIALVVGSLAILLSALFGFIFSTS